MSHSVIRVLRLDDLARDVRHAARSMRRTPLFAGVAMVTLAVGIGANAAIFTLVNAVVLRPLAYADAAQLVSLDTGNGQFGLAPAEYFELRTINHAFSAVGAYTMRDVNLSTG